MQLCTKSSQALCYQLQEKRREKREREKKRERQITNAGSSTTAANNNHSPQTIPTQGSNMPLFIGPVPGLLEPSLTPAPGVVETPVSQMKRQETCRQAPPQDLTLSRGVSRAYTIVTLGLCLTRASCVRQQLCVIKGKICQENEHLHGTLLLADGPSSHNSYDFQSLQ